MPTPKNSRVLLRMMDSFRKYSYPILLSAFRASERPRTGAPDLFRISETFGIQHSQLAGDGRDLDLQAGQVGCRRDKVDHGIDRDSQSEGLAGDAELGEHDRVAGQRAAGDGRHRQRQKPSHNDHREEPRGRDGRAEIFRHAQAGRHKSDRNAGHIEDLFQGHGEMREHRRDTQLLLAGL